MSVQDLDVNCKPDSKTRPIAVNPVTVLMRDTPTWLFTLYAVWAVQSAFTPIACMKNFTTYLSTAPVVALVWFTITAGLLIEINRFFPDPLVFSL